MTLRFLGCAAVAAMVLATPAWADTTVKVALWDRGGGMMDMNRNMGFGMGMRMGMRMRMHSNMPMGMMGIDTTLTEVPAGKVTFEAVNFSKELVHELIVAPVASTDAELPYDDAKNAVNEEAAKGMGEIEDLEPGASGTLTLDLKPGTYVLFCNVPGHYMAGMWTGITVK